MSACVPNQSRVAPKAVAMSRDGHTAPLRTQPKVPGNCCLCQCCGAAPGPVDVKNIVADGGRFVQAQDGRVIEYFVYGSEEPDARILLQIAGSMCTGALFKEMPGLVGALREHNVKAISITVPGHGYSSNHPQRRIGGWPRDDVEPVFLAEGVSGRFMLEGSSYGSAHAMAVMHHFGSRVEGMHLHVPYIPIELRRELGLKEYGAHDLIRHDYQWVASWRSWWLFCCCSSMMGCQKACPSLFVEDKFDKEAGFPLTKVIIGDINRSTAASIHGLIYNALVPQISLNWGFDLRHSDVSGTAVLVSYGDADEACPPEHGKFLYEYYHSKALAAAVNVGQGGHEAHMAALGRGDLVRKLFALCEKSQAAQ